jgi:glycine dehydrogenase subunit 1
MSENQQPFVHPYIPNSAPAVREEMLREIGVDTVGTLYQEIPPQLRFNRPLNLPKPFKSELALKRHVERLLLKNKTCGEYINFLGAGCAQHYVPSVCDEINSRGEFLTAYGGVFYSDHGKFQAFFEYQSLICELLDMDVTSLATYDWAGAISTSLLMGCRITGRNQILVPMNLDPEKRMQMHNFCRSSVEILDVEFDRTTGLLDLSDLRSKISEKTGSVYFENPTYLGAIETRGKEISKLAHDNGALCIVGADPISLGLLEPPSHYGADIACGDIHPLGIHMNYGGGLGGFIATKDDPGWMSEFPTILVTAAKTSDEKDLGYAWANWDKTSYVQREQAKDFTGTTTALWTITAAVYLALMGPQGMREVGEAMMGKAQYAIKKLGEVKGVKCPVFSSVPFKEFLVNFDGTGVTVKDINKALLGKGIFGGKDVSAEFPQLGQTALYCVTEVITKEDIDTLVDALGEVVR